MFLVSIYFYTQDYRTIDLAMDFDGLIIMTIRLLRWSILYCVYTLNIFTLLEILPIGLKYTMCKSPCIQIVQNAAVITWTPEIKHKSIAVRFANISRFNAVTRVHSWYKLCVNCTADLVHTITFKIRKVKVTCSAMSEICSIIKRAM